MKPKNSTPSEFRHIENIAHVVADDIRDRFSDNTAVLSIAVRYDKDGGYPEVVFLASGHSEVLAMGIAEVMEQHPELMLLLQRSAVLGNVDNIMSNLHNHIGGLDGPTPNPFDFDDFDDED